MNFDKEELKGWEYHVNRYSILAGSPGKDSTKNLNKSKNTLKKLDRKRKKISSNLFNDKYCKNMTGSKNLTSDYDLTLFLKTTDTDILDKFIGIINHYQNNNIDLSKIFDMNIYFSELLCDKLNPKINNYFYLRKIESLKCGHKHLFINLNKDLYLIQLQFVMLKYIQNNLPTNKLKYNFSKTKRMNKSLTNIKDNNISTLYNLQCNKVKEFHEIFKKLNNECEIKNQKIDYTDICKYMTLLCESRYYSIEGYYCQSTMNVVVYNLTLGVNLLLNKYDHYLSITENWFDLYSHLEGNYDYINLLKYSKYLYRIYYSWNELVKLKVKNKYMKNSEIKNKLKSLKFLIKNRSDIQNIDKYKSKLDYVYTSDITKDKLLNIMINQINSFIFKTRTQKRRK